MFFNIMYIVSFSIVVIESIKLRKDIKENGWRSEKKLIKLLIALFLFGCLMLFLSTLEGS